MALTIPKIQMSGASAIEFMVVAGSDSVKRFGERVQPLRRPGAAGLDFQQIGEQAEPFAIRIMRDCSTVSEARQVERDLKLVRGNLVTYTDETDYEWSDVMVLDVSTRNRIAKNGTGFVKSAGNSNWRVDGSITMQLTVDPDAE